MTTAAPYLSALAPYLAPLPTAPLKRTRLDLKAHEAAARAYHDGTRALAAYLDSDKYTAPGEMQYTANTADVLTRLAEMEQAAQRAYDAVYSAARIADCASTGGSVGEPFRHVWYNTATQSDQARAYCPQCGRTLLTVEANGQTFYPKHTASLADEAARAAALDLEPTPDAPGYPLAMDRTPSGHWHNLRPVYPWSEEAGA